MVTYWDLEIITEARKILNSKFDPKLIDQLHVMLIVAQLLALFMKIDRLMKDNGVEFSFEREKDYTVHYGANSAGPFFSSKPGISDKLAVLNLTEEEISLLFNSSYYNCNDFGYGQRPLGFFLEPSANRNIATSIALLSDELKDLIRYWDDCDLSERESAKFMLGVFPKELVRAIFS